MRAGHATTENERTLTVRMPPTLRRRGGRQQVVTPEGASRGARRPRVDNALVKAVARPRRWKRLMESGRFASVRDFVHYLIEGRGVNFR